MQLQNRTSFEKFANENETAQILISIPGFGPINAPSIKQSANTIRFGSLTKQARTSLKHLFVQASWAAQRTKQTNQFQNFYQTIT